MRAFLPVLMSLSLVLPLVGCSSGDPPGPEKLPTVPVSGEVLYQGNPVANADVAFQHSEGNATATAKTDAQGKFSLKTYGTEEGAPVGSYKVTVAVSGVQEIEPGVLAPEPPGGFKSPIPTTYANPATTDIQIDVPEGGATDLKIELK